YADRGRQGRGHRLELVAGEVRAGLVPGYVQGRGTQPGQALLGGTHLVPQHQPVPALGGGGRLRECAPDVGRGTAHHTAEPVDDRGVDVGTAHVETRLRDDVQPAYGAAHGGHVGGTPAQVHDRERGPCRQIPVQ